MLALLTRLQKGDDHFKSRGERLPLPASLGAARAT
jgi:hypothetical protein